MNEQKFTGIRYLLGALEDGVKCDYSYHIEYHCKNCIRNRLLVEDVCILLEHNNVEVICDETSVIFNINNFKYIIFFK